MTTHPIFKEFERVQCVGTGDHVFDFLGCRTNVKYKRGWDKHAVNEGSVFSGSVPVVNEHYFDWICVLRAVNNSSQIFRMAELGAGWAPWLVRGHAAAKQRSNIEKCELVAIEADPTHLEWIREHFDENGLNSDAHEIVFGAIASQKGHLKFPKITDPTQDYGASIRAATGNVETITVPSFTISDIVERFSGPVDLIHIDIQGAEYDTIPQEFEMFESQIKSVMVGTHISSDLHEELRNLFLAKGWTKIFNFPRNGDVETEYGNVKFGDGFLYFENPRLT